MTSILAIKESEWEETFDVLVRTQMQTSYTDEFAFIYLFIYLFIFHFIGADQETLN